MVLLVSHSLILHKIIEIYLGKNFPGITVDKVTNDIDAVKKIQASNNYKLILSDWDIEYVDGYKLLVTVRQVFNNKDIPFIIITEKRDKESILKCIQASATGYVMKPVDDDVIDQKIKSYFEKLAPQNIASVKKQVSMSSMNIPSCPAIITELYTELKKPKPNLRDIVERIKKDVAVTATLIKLANSPIYGAGKVDGIERALNVLGLNNFKNMVLASALQNSVKEVGIVSEAFWRHSVASATVCSYLSKRKAPELVDSAYLTGLFHDCAIPLFLKKFPDYEKIFDAALAVSTDVTQLEDKEFITNHADMGALIVKGWKVEDKIIEAIKYHHNSDIKTAKTLEYYRSARQLWAILVLSEHICHHYGYGGISPARSDEEFLEIFEETAVVMNLDIQDVKDLKDDAFAIIKNITGSF